jgi:hypothetical protein
MHFQMFIRKAIHAQALERDGSPIMYALEDVRKPAKTRGVTHGADLNTVGVQGGRKPLADLR